MDRFAIVLLWRDFGVWMCVRADESEVGLCFADAVLDL